MGIFLIKPSWTESLAGGFSAVPERGTAIRRTQVLIQSDYDSTYIRDAFVISEVLFLILLFINHTIFQHSKDFELSHAMNKGNSDSILGCN